ncbi:MAG: NRDE family protein [Alphaproteobacteria bacterium]|nr:NRDE family protein [Alphaproteobacteria bacterium]
MCTFVILRRPGHDWPVLVGANRDEMIGRPWRAPGRHWPNRPEVVAGLDELAGGSWFGINDHGVIAGILNRFGSLGPAPGMRSRGELVLEALDHADAAAAAHALANLDPKAYRTFNLVLADNREAFWLKHADPSGAQPIELRGIESGLAMIAAGDLNDSTPRLERYRPLFERAEAPDPADGDWSSWEKLLADDRPDPADGTANSMRFLTPEGFGTVSSALVALPAPGIRRKPAFRFAAWQPKPTSWGAIEI